MRMSNAIVSLVLVVLSSTGIANTPSVINEQYSKYTLEEFTAMEIPLVADQATRIIFPFVLDNPGFEPTLKYSIKPGDVFSVTEATDVKGQNVLILENSQEPEAVAALFDDSYNYTPILGQFFLSVNGYNLSIRLKTSADPSEQIQNIVFDLSEDERSHLIDVEVQRYKDELDRQLEEEMTGVDDRAQSYGVQYIADVLLADPKTKRVRIEEESEDQSIQFYAESFESYGDMYFALRYEVKNDGPGTLFLEHVEHFIVDGDRKVPVDGFGRCEGRIERGETQECVFVSENSDFPDAGKITTEFGTPDGIQVVTW